LACQRSLTLAADAIPEIKQQNRKAIKKSDIFWLFIFSSPLESSSRVDNYSQIMSQ
jgi:hypothetical protein